MRFWDSSAIVPLLSGEASMVGIERLLQEDDEVTVWWGTWAECAVAVSRLRREGRLDDTGEERARAVLGRLADSWTEGRPTGDLRLLATLLAKDHPLRAADALQLATALIWCEGDVAGKEFVCLDNRLRRAAHAEGFIVLPKEPV